jgi:hypothetical protein
VHAGFHRAFKYLWPRLEPAITAALDDLDHLFVAGHSLGGALAVVATAHLFTDPSVGDALREKLRRLHVRPADGRGRQSRPARHGGLVLGRSHRGARRRSKL